MNDGVSRRIDRDGAVVAREAGDELAGEHLHAVLLKRRLHLCAGELLLQRKQAMLSLDQRHLAPERLERLCHLDSGCAAPHDHQPPRDLMRRGRLAVGPHASSRSARPSIAGTSATDPPGNTTARRASNSSLPTVTRRSSVIRPWPRNSVTPWLSSHGSCAESSGAPMISSRRRRTAATSSLPLVASRAPAIRLASASTSCGRSRALDGMHAQCAHSPPTSRSSTSATVRPWSASRPAACSPDGPPPTTTTSKIALPDSL